MALKSLKKSRRITHIILAKTLKALLDGPVTPQEVAEITGVRLATAQEWMRALRKEECVHIGGWVPDSRGRDATAVYKLGAGKDKPRFKVSDTEKSRRYRERKRLRQIQLLTAGVST